VYKSAGLSIQSFFLLYASIAIIVLLCAIMWPLALSRKIAGQVDGMFLFITRARACADRAPTLSAHAQTTKRNRRPSELNR
jgi:nitrogen fixation/metabolism regulation signal transduction histidine kinase